MRNTGRATNRNPGALRLGPSIVVRPMNELRMATISGRVELANISRIGSMFFYERGRLRELGRRNGQEETNLNLCSTRRVLRLPRSARNCGLNSSASLRGKR